MVNSTPSESALRQVIVQVMVNVLRLFTRRPFTILIPILAGALIAPVLTGIGIGAQVAGIMALIVIVALMLVLSSAWIRRVCWRGCQSVAGALRQEG